MTNRQIVRQIEMFRSVRADLLDILAKSDSVQAAQHVLSINSKIELLLTMWNWSDETVDFPHPH